MGLEELLTKDKVVIFDGGMGTEIIKRGIQPGKLPDLLNMEQPAAITGIHKAYYDAGADMCQTCTFGSSLLNLEKYGVGDKLAEINAAALDNIRKACPPGRFVVGDIGPSGELRPPVGRGNFEVWSRAFPGQIKALAAGVDAWHVETMSDIEEATSIVKIVKEMSGKPVFASMTYKRTPRGFFTIMGDSVEKCVGALEKEGASVIGANCTLGSRDMKDLAAELLQLASVPVLVKPNAGKPRLEGTTTVYEQSPAEFAQDIKAMVDLGVKIVGGCCGTSPDSIRAARELLN